MQDIGNLSAWGQVAVTEQMVAIRVAESHSVNTTDFRLHAGNGAEELILLFAPQKPEECPNRLVPGPAEVCRLPEGEEVSFSARESLSE